MEGEFQGEKMQFIEYWWLGVDEVLRAKVELKSN